MNTRTWLLVAPVPFVSVGLSLADSEIHSTRVLSEPLVHIKPCEPVFVLLSVNASVPTGASGYEAPSALADDVIVNGRHYGSRMAGVNAVALFVPNESVRKKNDDGSVSMQVVGILYWNAEDGDCLFNERGVYEVEFPGSARVEVIVEEATADERNAVRELRGSGAKFAMFVMNGGDYGARELVPRAEKMLERYGNTVYAKHLSIALGTAKLRGVRPQFDTDGNCDPRSYVDERVAAAKKYFEPYCQGNLESPFEAAAAYQLAQELAAQLRFMPEDAQEERTRVRGQAKVLFQKVKDSPYFLGNVKQAATTLDELGD